MFSKKVEELTSLRGILAFFIVFTHIPIYSAAMDYQIIRNGYLMVQVFFVLSGFVIYKNYHDNLNDNKDIIRFLFLRFGRLYPVHVIFLLIFFIIEVAKFVAQYYGIFSPNSSPFNANNIAALFQNIFLLQAFNPAHTFNGPAWSISAEFFTYILFALSALIFRKFKLLFFLLFCIASLFLITFNVQVFRDVLSCTSGFFLGCIIAYLQEKQLKIRSNIVLPKYLSLLVFIVIILFLIFKPGPVYDPVIYFLAAFLIFFLVVTRNGYFNLLLKWNFFTYLGTISYSIYMSHLFVIWIVNNFIRVVLNKSEIFINGQSVPQLTSFESFIALSIIVSIVLILSYLVYKFVENPFRLSSRSYAFKKFN